MRPAGLAGWEPVIDHATTSETESTKAERLDRLAPAAMVLGALSREPSSFGHVPELGPLGDRIGVRLGAPRAAELTAAGAALDLNRAAIYARQQIDAARRDRV